MTRPDQVPFQTQSRASEDAIPLPTNKDIEINVFACLFLSFGDSVNVQKIAPSYTEEQENKNMAMAREMKKAH